MFSEIHSARSKRRRLAIGVSVGIHVVLLFWLVRSPAPTFIKPSFVVKGEINGSTTQLYWRSDAGERGTAAMQGKSADLLQPYLAAQPRLTFAPSPRKVKGKDRNVARMDLAGKSESEDERRVARAAPVGSPWGSLGEGTLNGYEVRPALPVRSVDPVLGAFDLQEGVSGDEVVEIVIDEVGNITSMTVLQSMGPAVDAKVLAALRSWHFRPATRDGVAIASKQDVHYHFPR